jgi:hypothetical protein
MAIDQGRKAQKQNKRKASRPSRAKERIGLKKKWSCGRFVSMNMDALRLLFRISLRTSSSLPSITESRQRVWS